MYSTSIKHSKNLGNADSSLNNPACLKIHPNAVFYIPTRTRIHLLKSQAKNHSTSSSTQKINAFRLLALCFFSLRTVKNYPLFSGLKTPQSTLTLTIRKKHNFQALGLCVLFPTLSIRKNTVSTQHILVNSQKKHTLLGSCLYVFFSPLHC